MQKKLAIIGSGDLGQQIAHYASVQEYKVVGFYDDFQEKGGSINGYKILGKIADIESDYAQRFFDELIIGIGYKHLDFKEKIYQRFEDIVPFATLIHSTSTVDPTAEIGKGTVIYPGCIIDQHVKIGDNTLLNVGCCIAHDTRIGDHSFLSPRVAIAGFVNIGKKNILGINSTIIDNIDTADGVQIGGGAVVIKNINRSGLYVGNPIRIIRYGEEE